MMKPINDKRIDISAIPAVIMYNILVRLPIKLSMRLKCVCKHWNRVISDPHYLTKSWTGDRKILLPFEPVDVLEENDTIRSMVTLSSSSSPVLEGGKVVTIAGSCNGIVLLVIQDHHTDDDHMVLYNPLTRVTSKPIIPRDLLHSHPCNKKHVYGYGYGSSTPDDVKIVRFRGCEYSSSSSTNIDNQRHTCDVYSTKTNSWTVLRDFVQDANWLNDVGTFANGSLYWISNRNNDNREFKIVALDVNSMVLSDIQVPNNIDHDYGLLYNHRCRRRAYMWSGDSQHYVNNLMWSVLGTLNGCLCIVSHQTITTGDAKKDGFNVWVMKEEEEGVADKKSWVNVSSFNLDLKSEFGYSPISILDDGNVLILIESFQELVIYDALKKGWPNYKVINISASPGCFQRIHGIEYLETLVSPSSLLIA